MSRRYIFPEDVALSAWVLENRERLGLTRYKLANLVGGAADGMHDPTIGRIETAKQPATYGQAVRLSLALQSPLPVHAGSHPMACPVCLGSPPKGFTCNVCGVSS